MNNPNPFVPQGSLLEQKNRKRTRFQVAVFTIFAVNILVITPMLIQGCSPSKTDVSNVTPAPQDTGAAPMPPDTNTTALPPVPAVTNPPIVSAPPVPPTPPTPPSSGTDYVIVKGDTLDSIHHKFSVSVKAIEDANPGIVPTKLQPGKKIQIPAATAAVSNNATVANDGSDIYVVKSGDSLSKIATDHHTTVKAIETLNNLKTTKIKVGDKLKVPPAKAAPAVDTTTAAPAPPVLAPATPAPASK